MKELEFFYNQDLPSIKFIPRKLSLNAGKTLLIKKPKSGATTLIIELLSRYKSDERLYFSKEDLRASADILAKLDEFLGKFKNIKALGIDDISSRDCELLLNSKAINNLECVILSTNEQSLKMDGFKTRFLSYLDYEEFIAFFRKNLDESAIFSHFLELGGVPMLSASEAKMAAILTQDILKARLNKLELNIIKECANFIAKGLSALEIYKAIKQSQKISKDSIYATLNSLHEQGYIALLPSIEGGTIKRLFFENFALKGALSTQKDFKPTLANMVFCELSRLDDEIFYSKDFDFILKKRKVALLCLPFSDPEIIFLKFKKLHKTLKELRISKLQIISIANSASLSIEGIKCEIMPFSQWALSLDG